MDVLILGAGNIGTVVAYDLARNFEVTVVDVNDRALESVKSFAEPLKFDVTKKERLQELMKKYELVVDTLPGKFGFYILKSAIEARTDIVDVSFMPENPLELTTEHITAVVDAGFAPGLSNIIMGHIYYQLGELDEALIRVGGLPKNPQPPLYYTSTWSPEDLLEEYTRSARIIKEGRIVNVDPLERINAVKLGGFEFEEFPSDGLRTLLYTIKAKNMEERTLRWKGHLEKIKMLKELGFLDEENRDFTLKILLSLMKNGEDFCIMEVYGRKATKEMRYFLIDEAREFSSMARVTGYTAAAISRLVIENKIEKGIVAPELIGMEDELFRYVLETLKARHINIKNAEGRI